MATWEMRDGERVLIRKTLIPGVDNLQDLPKKVSAKAAAKAKSKPKKDEVKS